MLCNSIEMQYSIKRDYEKYLIKDVEQCSKNRLKKNDPVAKAAKFDYFLTYSWFWVILSRLLREFL